VRGRIQVFKTRPAASKGPEDSRWGRPAQDHRGYRPTTKQGGRYQQTRNVTRRATENHRPASLLVARVCIPGPFGLKVVSHALGPCDVRAITSDVSGRRQKTSEQTHNFKRASSAACDFQSKPRTSNSPESGAVNQLADFDGAPLAHTVGHHSPTLPFGSCAIVDRAVRGRTLLRDSRECRRCGKLAPRWSIISELDAIS
jgi:hypothetical protein